jgi:hypothetical protein
MIDKNNCTLFRELNVVFDNIFEIEYAIDIATDTDIDVDIYNINNEEL